MFSKFSVPFVSGSFQNLAMTPVLYEISESWNIGTRQFLLELWVSKKSSEESQGYKSLLMTQSLLAKYFGGYTTISKVFSFHLIICSSILTKTHCCSQFQNNLIQDCQLLVLQQKKQYLARQDHTDSGHILVVHCTTIPIFHDSDISWNTRPNATNCGRATRGWGLGSSQTCGTPGSSDLWPFWRHGRSPRLLSLIISEFLEPSQVFLCGNYYQFWTRNR